MGRESSIKISKHAIRSGETDQGTKCLNSSTHLALFACLFWFLDTDFLCVPLEPVLDLTL